MLLNLFQISPLLTMLINLLQMPNWLVASQQTKGMATKAKSTMNKFAAECFHFF